MRYESYTDGSSRGNPGKAGWGCIIMSDAKVREYSGRSERATNNQMEIYGVLYAMNFAIANLNKDIEGDEIEIFSDSEYTVKGCNIWVHGWVKNNWKTSQKKEVLNREMWESVWKAMHDLNYKNIKFKVTHVRGHNGHIHNERADIICTSAALETGEKLFVGDRADYDIFLDKFSENYK